MNAPILFLDTETTGLSLDDDIWEIGAIRREPDGSQTEHHWFVEHDRRKCVLLPESFLEDHASRYRAGVRQEVAAAALAALTADRPHIVGSVPNFDTERIALLLRRFGYEPGWHYHLIDVENLAVGYIAGMRAVPLSPPWESDDLSLACGVEPPGTERHTALGDARWAMRLYDAIIGRGS